MILGAVTVHDGAVLYIVQDKLPLPILVAQFVLKVAITVFEKIAYTVLSSSNVNVVNPTWASLSVFHHTQVYPLFVSLHAGSVTVAHWSCVIDVWEVLFAPFWVASNVKVLVTEVFLKQRTGRPSE